MKYKKGLKIFTTLFVLLFIISSLVLFLGDGDKIPDWNTVFELFDLSPSGEYAYDADYFKVINVGQGDCLMFYSNGKTALIDTGPEEYAYVLPNCLDSSGIDNIDVMVLTHYHDDHTGGIESILGKYNVKNLVIPDARTDEEGYKAVERLRKNVQLNSGGIYKAVPGLSIQVGEFEITVVGYSNNETTENNRSIILIAKIDDVKILLMGDAEKSVEDLLIDKGIDLSCDILKVGHHGSNTSTCERFLENCSPKYSVVSCGLDNAFSHPHDDVITRLERKEINLYRTDYDGDVTFLIENGDINVKTQK